MAWPDFDYDVYEDFEDALGGAWSEVDPDGTVTPNSTNAEKNGTYGLECLLTTSTAAYIQCDMGGTKSAVSFGFWYRMAPTTDTNYGIVVARWAAGIESNIQMNLYNTQSSGSSVLRLRNGAGTYSTNSKAISLDTWYWVTCHFQVDTDADVCTLRVYDASHNEIDAETECTLESNSSTARQYLFFGANVSGSSSPGTEAVGAWIDDIVIDYTDATFPLLGWETAGGTTYNESCADGVALSESAAPVNCIFGVAAADGIAADENTGAAGIFPRAAADGVDVQDAATSLATLIAAAADGVALNDLATMLAIYLALASDGVAVNDTASAAALGVIEVLAEDGIGLDDAASAVATLAVTCTDSMVTDDGVTATFQIVATSADGVALNDAVTVVVTMPVAAADGVALDDAASALSTFLVTALDGVALQDVAVSVSGALASGRVTITFSTKRGAVSITGKRSTVTMTGKKAGVTLS